MDIGGTFTDAAAVTEDGREVTAKALSTPGNLARGVIAAVESLHLDWADIGSFVHGTTVGLNAFLERRGARVALLTTAGFRDVYEIGRANRPAMYDVRYRPPAPLVARRDVYELHERLAADGSVLRALDEMEVRNLAARIRGRYDAVAVVLLHAYRNPEHEDAVERVLADVAPELRVLCSHDIAAEWREYERTSTTVLSAYIAPIVADYLARLEAELGSRGATTTVRVMQSAGGVMSTAVARAKPIQTLLSGPVGGTLAGVALADDLGLEHLICIDMGGTSADVSLVVAGAAEVELQAALDGHPLLMPAVAIRTLGAGGGSVAYLEAGALRVGPRSAGAVPGPACYGRGGSEPTVTDANVVLGRLPGAARLGGEVALDVEAARVAVDTLATSLGIDRVGAARGIVAVADAAMADAIREITVARGIDPRDFSLVAFGGAGPLHAASLAEELEIPRVVVPANPGVLSAWGMLHADTRHDLVRSFFVSLAELSGAQLGESMQALCERARALLAADGVPPKSIELIPAADLRYVGQEYAVTVPWSLEENPEEVVRRLPERFAAAHLDRYGHNNPGEGVECVNLRVTALGRVGKVRRRSLDRQSGRPTPAWSERTWLDERWCETPVYWRESLGAGATLAGPAIVLEDACTTVVPAGWGGKVSSHGHLILERGRSAS
ncbi:MAG TPA: hydantoinase/oxoprolinase family protein [Gaiellaceae bacterium]|nr:hydantoinase/oxoprolinase family protein [Gaiellaceae bacterium]